VCDADDRCEASGSSSEAGADSAGYERVDETSSSDEHVDTTRSDDDWAEGGDRNGNGERLWLGVDKVIGDGGGAVFGDCDGDELIASSCHRNWLYVAEAGGGRICRRFSSSTDQHCFGETTARGLRCYVYREDAARWRCAAWAYSTHGAAGDGDGSHPSPDSRHGRGGGVFV
jgi:hypothetical protein